MNALHLNENRNEHPIKTLVQLHRTVTTVNESIIKAQ